MNMKNIMDILNNLKEDIQEFLILYKNQTIIILVVVVFILGFLKTKNNYYHALLFYPDIKNEVLLAERRAIIKSSSKEQKIINTVEELISGPVDYNIKNIFPLESKLLNIRLENNILHLNFNRETLMNLNLEKYEKKNNYYLYLQSITDTVCHQFRDIKIIKFYFDGKETRFVESYGPIDQGIKPDWKLLKK